MMEGRLDHHNDNSSSAHAEDEASSSSGSKRSSTQGSTEHSDEKKMTTTRLASDETRAVTCSRLLMIFVLLALAATATVTVFKYTTLQEQEDFEVRFTNFALQIIGVYNGNAKNILESYENFAIQLTALAASSGSTWPFVTFHSFEAQATRVQQQTGARTVGVSHFIQEEDREAWENYTVDNQGWRQEALAYRGINETAVPIVPHIYGDTGTLESVDGPHEDYGFYAPVWQQAPFEATSVLSNYDPFRAASYPRAYDRMIEVNGAIISEVFNLGRDGDLPESYILVPIYKEVKEEQNVEDMVADFYSILPWNNYFLDLLPEGINGIVLVISNTCNQTFSYQINGRDAEYLGVGDWHDTNYDEYLVESHFSPFSKEMECAHTLSLYPSKEFESLYATNKPLIYTTGVLCLFLLTTCVFLLYDCFVERRQEKVMSTAERSTAIVSSLFPQKVADRLMKQEEGRDAAHHTKKKPSKPMMLGQAQAPGGGLGALKHFHGGSDQDQEVALNDEESSSKPIAELFPAATVLFADIVGFTAWSSTREPSQVFELLEEIYSSFDTIARRKKVFKVETIGDCYMAATGLPEKRDDHAILMARFARDCLRKMLSVVRKLEVRLGPDTGDLGMRIGVHSGPVTAGVLRGEKARFQLFGDTVNTAARLESTGNKNKIHVSDETAKLIAVAGNKDIWTVPRKVHVEAKGKGKLQTHWLAYTNQGGKSASSVGTFLIPGGVSVDTSDSDDLSTTELLEDSRQKKLDRSIDWGVDILQRLLKRVVAMRGGIEPSLKASRVNPSMPTLVNGSSPLEEVSNIIELPSQERVYPVHPIDIELPPEVLIQLRSFVKTIASMYQDNPFHSFEHAMHVTQSVTKLLTRVVTSDFSKSERARLHQYTYGITSDPLAQFAVAFSALIHDVDHPGVPNAILVKEQTPGAVLYRNKSVAEQNSVDVAWELLSEPCYSDLRSCIFTTTTEFQRFRQLVVNTVMATDIVDKELGAARKKRWDDAFNRSEEDSDQESSSFYAGRDESDSVLDANRKATIVIEHLIQASDVAHTMQHWHVYLKWNQRFFNECYDAFREDRSDKDPSKGWYEGELGFFDYYIIPLAKKLQECQVFGVASDEYLQYAEANRHEWQEKGKELVKTYLEKYKASQGQE